MWRPGLVAALSATLALAGCSLTGDSEEPSGSLKPAPPIEAMNVIVPSQPVAPGGPPAMDDLRYLNMTPVSELRAIARLPLRRGGRAALLAWTARNGRLCTNIVYRYPDTRATGSGGGSGPFGPCEPWTTCGQICLARAADIAQSTAVLGGTVSASADQLRIVFLDGESARYPLRGPIVSRFPDRRAFLLDLGGRMYERLELLVDGEPKASVDVPGGEIETQLCYRQFRPTDPTIWPCLRKTRSR